MKEAYQNEEIEEYLFCLKKAKIFYF